MSHWYDITVGRYDQLPAMLEAVEADGWEVLCVMNTGAVAQADGIMMAGKPQVVPVIAAICRTEKMFNEESPRRRLFEKNDGGSDLDKLKPFRPKGGV